MTIADDLATLREGLFYATRTKSALERSPVPGTPIGDAHFALDRVEAVIEAARELSRIEATGVLPDFLPLAAALAALDEGGET